MNILEVIKSGDYLIPITKAHSTLGDCLSTLAVCKAMVAKTESVK